MANESTVSGYNYTTHRSILQPYHHIMAGFIADCAMEIHGIRDVPTFSYLQGRDGLVTSCHVYFDIDWLYHVCKQDQDTRRTVLTRTSWLAQSICYGNPVLNGASSQYETGYIPGIEDVTDEVRDLFLMNMGKFLKLEDSHLSLREVFSKEFLTEVKDPQRELDTITRIWQTYRAWFKTFKIESIKDTMLLLYLQIQSIWAMKLRALEGKLDYDESIIIMLAHYYDECAEIVCDFDTPKDLRIITETMLVGLTLMLPDTVRTRIANNNYITDHRHYVLIHLILHSKYHTCDADKTIAKIYQMNIMDLMTCWSYRGPESSAELMYLYVYLESLVNTKHASTTNTGDHNSRQQIWELVKRAKMEKLYPHRILYVNDASTWNGVFSPLLVATDPYYYYLSILSELQIL